MGNWINPVVNHTPAEIMNTTLFNRIEGNIAYLKEHLDPVEAAVTEHIPKVAGAELGHVKLGSELNTGLELDANNTLRLVHRPTLCGRNYEYTDAISGPSGGVNKALFIQQSHDPFRTMTVLLKNRSSSAKFIQFDIDPVTGRGIVTGTDANGQVRKAFRDSALESYGIGVNDPGYGACSNDCRVSAKVKVLDSNNYFEIEFNAPSGESGVLDVEVYWWMH